LEFPRKSAGSLTQFLALFKRGAGGDILADNTSDLLWKMAMDRRGLAYDQASILSNAVHARWVAQMIQHKHGVPPQRYEAVTWSQLHNADVELFTLATQKAKGGIRPDPRGCKPLDALVDHLMEDSRVTFFLMPLPQTGSGGRRDSPAEASDTQPKRQRVEPSADWGKGQKKKDKGKGKGDSKGKGDVKRTLPGELFKQTKNGKHVCPDFNSPGGCQMAPKTTGLETCAKGLHLCWAPKCRRRNSHGFCAHTKADE